MLIKSFLAIPKPNLLTDLEQFISEFKNCEISKPEKGEDVLIIVMENDNQEMEDQTLRKLHESKSLEHIMLVSSFNEAV
jgi:nitrate reductase NapAB chaperone NapD